jgi:hypothetical protein
MLLTSRTQQEMSLAERLLWLEREDAHLSKTLHVMTRLRARYQEEARLTRMTLTAEDRARYEKLKISEEIKAKE